MFKKFQQSPLLSLILPRFSLHFLRNFSLTCACIFTKDCWSSTLSTRPRAVVSKCSRSRSARFTLDLVRYYWRKMTLSTLFITLLADPWKFFKANLLLRFLVSVFILSSIRPNYFRAFFPGIAYLKAFSRQNFKKENNFRVSLS